MTRPREHRLRKRRSFRVVGLPFVCCWLLCLSAAGAWAKAAAFRLEVFPSSIQISNRNDTQRIIAQAIYPDGLTRDVTEHSRTKVLNAKIAKLNGNLLTPLTDGQTELEIKYKGETARVPVSVASSKDTRPISFHLDVMPSLTKAGCNSGGCHGAASGKDGFGLSLFGYNAEGDYFKITREAIGRRINLAIPEESLLLQKGLGAVPHTGGERFTTNSETYRALLEWIQAGAPRDQKQVAKCVRVELFPREAVLEGTNSTQQFIVRAHYDDGSDRDVTTLAVFASSNESTAKVSDKGLVTPGRRGETFVTARFDTHTVGAPVIVIPKDLRFTFPQIREHNYIDTAVHEKLRKLRMAPSELCDDATFLRRVYVDLIGLLPSPAEVREFVEDKDEKKRARMIDRLLEREEFTDLWVMKWGELLQNRTILNQFSPKNTQLYHEWLREQISRNVPVNQMVHQLVTATGSTFKNPEASYYQLERNTLKTAENAAQVFLGMRIQCAQCHNHPFDRWTMEDYYSFSAFFAQVGRKTAEDPREMVVFDRTDGEVKHPVTGANMRPKFLGAATPDLGGQTRRKALADWLTSPENPFFARNIANIAWAHFLGVGIVDPVDDVRISNPPSNPELLELLGRKLTDYNFDLKKLVRDICNSRTYQLSTRANDSNALDSRNFAKANVRRMRAEVLLDCINQVTGSSEKFTYLPRGERAVKIADANVNNFFLTSFGRATRETPCSTEVNTEPTLSQALHLLNGSTTHEKVQNGGVVRALRKQGKTRAEIIEELYLRCFARLPTSAETEKLGTFFESGSNEETVLNDIFWALLNAKEFVFNH